MGHLQQEMGRGSTAIHSFNCSERSLHKLPAQRGLCVPSTRLTTSSLAGAEVEAVRCALPSRGAFFRQNQRRPSCLLLPCCAFLTHLGWRL